MRSPLLLALLLTAAPSVQAAPQPLGVLWQRGDGAVVLTECPPGDHDEYCRAVDLRRGNDTVRLGGGYMQVRLLWVRRAGEPGPDAVVLGDSGGSGGDADLFAVSFAGTAPPRKIGGERFDQVTAHKGPGPLRLRMPFDIEFFNGASHAGAVTLPLPVRWAAGDFAVDVAGLTSRSFSEADLDFRALAMRQELLAWAHDFYPATRLYPPEARDGTPVTLTAIVEMTLTGHADQARALLDRAWPTAWDRADRHLGGKDTFWTAICAAIVGNPLWKRFRLDRLPHADLIRTGAAAGDHTRRVPG